MANQTKLEELKEIFNERLEYSEGYFYDNDHFTLKEDDCKTSINAVEVINGHYTEKIGVDSIGDRKITDVLSEIFEMPFVNPDGSINHDAYEHAFLNS